MTKKQIKQALSATLATAWMDCKSRIEILEIDKGNPTIALMIEKNKGYMLACEDMTKMLYDMKIG